MKTCVILNPNAGGAGDLETLSTLLAELPGTLMRFTEKPGDARRLARAAVRQGAELVVAAGGDGTLNEVVNGMAVDFGRSRLGLLPLGTGNDFARSIDVPAEIEDAVAVLAAGRTRAVDVGRVRIGRKMRHFLNMAAGGFGGHVSEKAEEVKDRWGPLAYLRAALGTLPKLTGFEARLELDDSERLDVEAYNVVVSNGRYVAAGIPVAPQAELDDGRLDLMIVPTASLPKLALLVPQVLRGRHLDSDLLLFRRARRIRIRSNPPMAFNADGELMGDQPACFEVLPQALEVVVGTGFTAPARPAPTPDR